MVVISVQIFMVVTYLNPSKNISSYNCLFERIQIYLNFSTTSLDQRHNVMDKIVWMLSYRHHREVNTNHHIKRYHLKISTPYHYNDAIMGTIASQITSLTIVFSIVYSDTDHRKHQSSTSLAFVRWIHRGPVNSPHKWPVTRKMFPFDDVIMIREIRHGV